MAQPRMFQLAAPWGGHVTAVRPVQAAFKPWGL